MTLKQIKHLVLTLVKVGLKVNEDTEYYFNTNTISHFKNILRDAFSLVLLESIVTGISGYKISLLSSSHCFFIWLISIITTGLLNLSANLSKRGLQVAFSFKL